MYKEWMVAITSVENASKYPVMFYDTANFNVDFTIGKFGRGPGEYTGISPYFFEKTEQGIALFTNFLFEEYYTLPISNNTEPVYRKKLFSGLVNNLQKLNDTLYLYSNPNLKESLFILYDSKNQREVRKFGHLPEVSVTIEGDDHLRTLYSCFISTSNDKRSIAVVFIDIPVFQIYKDYELHIEIRVSRESDCPTPEDLFDRKCKKYYSNPYVTDNLIWMKYVNAISGTDSEVTELHSWTWDGKLTGRYELNSPSINFTVSDNERSLYLFALKPENNEVRKYTIPD
jgi:hypothetical protein